MHLGYYFLPSNERPNVHRLLLPGAILLNSERLISCRNPKAFGATSCFSVSPKFSPPWKMVIYGACALLNPAK